MKTLIITTAGLLGWLYASSFVFAQITSTNPNLLSDDWSVAHVQKLNAEPKAAVWKFINNLQGGTGSGKLCSFKFANLRQSKQLSLVVSDDGGGTADCNDVEIFDKTQDGIEHFDFITIGGAYFDSIEDINGDGNHELVVDEIFATGGIEHCVATGL